VICDLPFVIFYLVPIEEAISRVKSQMKNEKWRMENLATTR
jgi:hypothetical protein